MVTMVISITGKRPNGVSARAEQAGGRVAVRFRAVDQQHVAPAFARQPPGGEALRRRIQRRVEIGAAGIHIRAIDLGYFDDWVRSIAAGEEHLPMTDYFFPMWRVERLTRDESGHGVASMTEQFNQRTGRELGEF